jgi:hypothetical protein
MHWALMLAQDVPSPLQHAVIVCIVLGLAMASAIWVPNVEFIFGLTGGCQLSALASSLLFGVGECM